MTPLTPGSSTMSTEERYAVGQRLHQSASTLIDRATDRRDGASVILKRLLKDAGAAQIIRLRREHEILTQLQLGEAPLEGAPRVRDFIDRPGDFTLVFEDFAGQPLIDRLAAPLPLKDALHIAAQLADILGHLHSRGVIHKDVNPNNILVSTAGELRVQLIDYNLATRLPRELPSLKNPDLLEGTLAYLAPEQSGRMNRAVDYRADLYSLGVTLYQMLTGQLPFVTRDALELLHAHIARPPQPPSAIIPSLPEVVSRITLKLMAKTAEERYRSAFGVRADLEHCCQKLIETGRIDDFDIAAHDPKDRFLLPQRLYGRENEIATLEAAFTRIKKKSRPELFLVTGAAGIGKSAVISELHRSMVAVRGFFVAGKFDQLQRDQPYSALLAAVAQILRQIQSENEQGLAAWRRRLTRALAGAGAAVVEVLPDLVRIIGPPPSLPELLPSESRIRFRNAFVRLISALTGGAGEEKNTLVLFIDDLQWADAATLEIFPQLLADLTMGSLLLIGAYRENEVGAAHPLLAMLAEVERSGCAITRLALAPLGRHSLEELIADTLALSFEKVRPLAELVAQKTQGNALFAGVFLTRLYKDGLIEFDPQRLAWTWDLGRIAAAPITDNVVEMLAQRLQALSPRARAVLQLGACIGNRFLLATLAAVEEKSPSSEELARALREAVAEGFLLPRGGEYLFAHDRLQQAAYSTLDEVSRRQNHLRIGRLLLRTEDGGERDAQIFAITEHLNLASELLSADERLRLSQLNLQAGKKARSAAAFAAAGELFTHGVRLLPSDAWTSSAALAMDLYIGQAECAYLCGRFDETKRLLEMLLDKAKTSEDKARLFFIRGVFFRHIGDTTSATWAVLDGLREFGVHIPRNPSSARTLLELLRTQRMLGKRSIDELCALPALSDARQIAILRMLSDASASAYFVGPNLLALLLLRMIRLSLVHGNHALSAIAYVFFAAIAGSGLGDFKKGEQMGQLALKLVERYPDAFVESQVKCIYVAIANHFSHAARDGSPLLVDSWRRGEESGNLTYAVYAVNTAARWSYLLGEPLDGLHADCDRYLEAVALTHHEAGYEGLHLIRQVVRALQGKTEAPTSLRASDFDEDACLKPLHTQEMRVQAHFHNNYRALLCLLFSRIDEGLAYCEKNQPDADQVMLGLLDIVEYSHVQAMLLAARAATQRGLSRRRTLYRLGSHLRKLKKWAAAAPNNFRHRYLMVRAELSRLHGKSDQALADYEEALTLERSGAFLRDEALTLERIAELLAARHLGDAAQIYWRRARAAYRRWGAHAKVLELEQKHAELTREDASSVDASHSLISEISVSTSSSSRAVALDLPTLLKATQALSSELTQEKLLLRLMNVVAENAGAQHAALALGSGGNLQVVARLNVEEGRTDATLVREPVSVEQADDLIPAIVHYATRRQERVLLDDAAVSGEFTKDPVVVRRRPRSVLCLPLLHQGEVKGALYLENNLAPAAFTSAGAELCATLCAQMAISVDNAALYADLERKVEERTRELRTTQARLLQLERETTEAQMAGGFAHEMRNALTGARMLMARAIDVDRQPEVWSLCVDNSQSLKELFLAVRGKLQGDELATVVERVREINGHEQKLHEILLGLDRALGRSLGLTRLLLEYAQLGKQQPGTDEVPLRPLCNALFDELGESLEKDQISLHIDIPDDCWLRANSEHVDSILRNLVLNAQDALREQSGEDRLERRIELRANLDEASHGDFYAIRITDTGAGILDENKSRIFEPFFSTKPATGTGLGLNMVRKLVSLYGGSIHFDSSTGPRTSFTTFTFTLPRR